ncbi:hypothetical protein L9F63_005988 [Diploptera punctata]|uniref:Cytochrome P450 n=1 Tax=Diploptera punctata TaxID=6984 RepID=A0AAD7ZC66_DIPPU|nr:hypothetical protein L9F63_005988 [Diploptera punctata]
MISYMLTGQRFPTKEHKKLRCFAHQALRFQKSVDVTGDAVALTPWLRFLAPKLTGFVDLMESTAFMLKYMEDAVKEHKNTYSEDDMRDFIDRYIQEKRNNPDSSFTDEQLNVVGVDYLFPASTTVTATLTFATAFLLNYPYVQVKMQEELDAVIGRDRLPTLDDRINLPYCEAVLRETMRKETLVPLSVVHRATEDTKLGDYDIPKDTAVITNLWSFHNDKEFWGDPEVFRPERFLDEDGNLLKKDFSLPFGVGKRVCAGETFARQYMFLLFTSIMQSFNIKCAPGTLPPIPKADSPGIIATKRGFWTRFEPRT